MARRSGNAACTPDTVALVPRLNRTLRAIRLLVSLRRSVTTILGRNMTAVFSFCRYACGRDVPAAWRYRATYNLDPVDTEAITLCLGR